MSGDEARALIDAASPGSDWWYDGRDIFHKPDGTNLDQIVIPLPETWHESQRVPRWRCPSGRGCRQLRSVAGGFTEARMSDKEPKQTYGAQGKPLRECPYCGRPVLRSSDKACQDHDDLPGLEPL